MKIIKSLITLLLLIVSNQSFADVSCSFLGGELDGVNLVPEKNVESRRGELKFTGIVDNKGIVVEFGSRSATGLFGLIGEATVVSIGDYGSLPENLNVFNSTMFGRKADKFELQSGVRNLIRIKGSLLRCKGF